MAMVGIKIEQSNICGLIATDQSFHTRFYYNLLYWVKHKDYYTYIRRTKALEPGGVLPILGGSSRMGYLFQASGI